MNLVYSGTERFLVKFLRASQRCLFGLTEQQLAPWRLTGFQTLMISSRPASAAASKSAS